MSKILNIGSINIDYVYKVPHFVQAGETLASVALDIFPGGKGLNQSVALAQAKGEVYHGGKIGSDGMQMLEILEAAGVDVTHTYRNGSATGHAIIQVNEAGQNSILLHAGANHQLTRDEMREILTNFGEGDLLVLQNEISDLAYIMEVAYEKGMKIAFNPSPITTELSHYPLEKVSWLILNEVEGCAITGEEYPDAILKVLKKRYPNAAILLTLGQEGGIYTTAIETIKYQAQHVKAVDTTAAGDTFLGFFMSAIFNGMDAREALDRASFASALAVSKQGAAYSIPTLEQVIAAQKSKVSQEK